MIPAALRPLQDRSCLPQIFSLLFAPAQQRPASHETRRDGGWIQTDRRAPLAAATLGHVKGADGVEGPPGSSCPNSSPRTLWRQSGFTRWRGWKGQRTDAHGLGVRAITFRRGPSPTPGETARSAAARLNRAIHDSTLAGGRAMNALGSRLRRQLCAGVLLPPLERHQVRVCVLPQRPCHPG